MAKETKKSVKAKLDELEIEYDPEASLEDLIALLPKDDDADADAGDTEEEDDSEQLHGFTVRDPLKLRPVELPLVIETPKGGWKNEAQAEYAATLNGYAYKNERKWKKKRAKLLKNLADIGEDPELLLVLRGGEDGGLGFKNHVTQGQSNKLGD